jgi:hypothetical protein
MNWKGGFFRLWLVASAIWGGVLIGLVMIANDGRLPQQVLDRAFGIWLVPSLAVLVIGTGIGWALRAFRA